MQRTGRALQQSLRAEGRGSVEAPGRKPLEELQGPAGDEIKAILIFIK